MKYLSRLLIIFVLTILMVSSGLAQSDLQQQTILMTFIPNIQFSPMYVAIEAGYFAEAGAEVSLEYLSEPEVVDLVAANENQFGIVSGEQVILATSQGRSIVYIYEWFQQYPIGIVYSDDIEINSVEDLTGLHIGIPGRFGATYSGFTTLLESADMVETDVNLEEIGFAAAEVFCVGAIEASVVYVNNEPLQIRNRAQNGDCGDVSAVNVLPVSSIIDLVSNGLITNQEFIDTDPEFVRAIVGAYDAGLSLTINNPARAYLLSVAYIEGLPLNDNFRAALEALADEQDIFLETNPDREAISASHEAMYDTLAEQFDSETLLQFEVLLASIELWDADQLGYTDAQSWVNMQDTLIALNQLDAPIELENIYTNEFLPEGD